VTEDEIIRFVAGLAGVEALTVTEESGAPEIAWGDSFFFYDPERNIPADNRLPFVTIVTKDYTGYDEASKLNRNGVFRLNIAVGRRTFEDLLGYPPAGHAAQHADIDYAALDTVIPHPLYATQGWVSILNPRERTAERARTLISGAHSRAAERHRPRG
jgi:hypothetical protein